MSTKEQTQEKSAAHLPPSFTDITTRPLQRKTSGDFETTGAPTIIHEILRSQGERHLLQATVETERAGRAGADYPPASRGASPSFIAPPMACDRWVATTRYSSSGRSRKRCLEGLENA